MRIGAHFSFGPLSSMVKAQQVKAAGYNIGAVQCFLTDGNSLFPNSAYLHQNVVEGFKEHQHNLNLVVAAHGPYIVNVCNPSGKLWRVSVDGVKRLIDACATIGIPYLVLHPGSHKNDTYDEGCAAFVRASCEIHHHIVSSGHDVVLLWENTAGGGTQIGRIENLHRLVRLVDSPFVKICLDTTHSFADGHPLHEADYREQFWDKFKDQVRWVHFNNPDTKVSLGSHLDRHRQSWKDAKWHADTMLDIAREWGTSTPLVMEADESAYDYNFMCLDEAGLL